MSGVPIEGEVAPGWEAVREAFATNFSESAEVGAAVAVYHHGRPVIDLSGGWFDAERTQPYERDTRQLVFSTTKGATAVVASILVDRGELDPDAPVAAYWPEFAAAGKESITVATMMAHQAGLPTVDERLSLEQVLAWDPIVEALAAQAPYWTPGTQHGYHALTYGWLAGEVIRRITGRSIGQAFASEVAEPLGLDFWIGLPEAEEPRVSPLLAPTPPPPEVQVMMAQFIGPDTLGGRALSLNGAFGTLGEEDSPIWNGRDVHAAEIPAANGIGTARSLARMYAACLGDVDGVRLLSSATVDRVRTTRTDGPDACLIVPTTFGFGFMTHGMLTPMAGPGSFGHAGAGGSLAFGHPESGLAFAYVMNQMDANLIGDLRAARLVDAAVRAAGSA